MRTGLVIACPGSRVDVQGRLAAALTGLALSAAVLAAAAGARAQESFPGTILFEDETPAAWESPGSVNELSAVVLRGPLGVTKPSSCAVLRDLGIPTLEIDPEALELVFSFRDPIEDCPEPGVEGPFAGVELRPVGLAADTTWLLRYTPPAGVPLPDGLPLELTITKTPLSALASQVRRITESAVDDFALAVGGPYLAWVAGDSDSGLQVLRSLRGGAPEPVEGGDNVDAKLSLPSVSVSASGRVAWEAPAPGGGDVNDLEIFVSSETGAVQLTNDGRADLDPQISDAFVVWVNRDESQPDASAEIFFADLSQPLDEATPMQLTAHGTSHRNPRISGSFAVWEGFDGEDFEIYFADLSAASVASRTIPDPDGALDRNPVIDGTRVVWERRDPHAPLPEQGDPDFELFTADLSLPDPVAVPVTQNAVEDGQAFLRGSRLVWSSRVDADLEIYLADLAGEPPFASRRITDNDVEDVSPRLQSPDRMLWQFPNASAELFGAGEVLTADAGAADPVQTLRITDDLLEDAGLVASDEIAAWIGLVDDSADGGALPANFEVFVLPEPPPLALRLAAGAALACVWTLRRFQRGSLRSEGRRALHRVLARTLRRLQGGSRGESAR